MSSQIVQRLFQPTCKLAIPLTRGAPCINAHQVRTTYIVKRTNEPNLAGRGKEARLRSRHYIYEQVENTNARPLGSIDCLLIKDVEGIGRSGEIATVSRSKFRRRLFPSGVAVYASEEKLQEYAHLLRGDIEESRQKKVLPETQKTLKQLARFGLRIPMSGDVPWTLDKSHVRIAFRRLGIVIKDESQITLPEEPVTEPQDIVVTVLVNGQISVPVRTTVHYFFKDSLKNEDIQFEHKVWNNPPLQLDEDSPIKQTEI